MHYVCSFFTWLAFIVRSYNEYLLFVPPLVPFTIYLPIPLALRYLTRFLHTRCVFQVLKNVCLLCCATPRFVFIKRNIFSIAISSMCCTVLYTYINDICMSVYILLFLAKATWLLLLPAKFELFLAHFLFVAFVFASFFFALLAFFREISQKSLNAPSPGGAGTGTGTGSSTTWTKTRRAEEEEQQQQATCDRTRHDEAAVKY